MQLRLYDQRRRHGAGHRSADVQALVGLRQGARIPSHAVQFCREHQRPSCTSLGVAWLSDCRTPPARVQTSNSRLCGCTGNVSSALANSFLERVVTTLTTSIVPPSCWAPMRHQTRARPHTDCARDTEARDYPRSFVHRPHMAPRGDTRENQFRAALRTNEPAAAVIALPDARVRPYLRPVPALVHQGSISRRALQQ